MKINSTLMGRVLDHKARKGAARSQQGGAGVGGLRSPGLAKVRAGGSDRGEALKRLNKPAAALIH